MPDKTEKFNSLEELAQHFRSILTTKKTILCFAYNGTGKTRLSMEFKNIGKVPLSDGSEETQRDTLYYNAFTEDLFVWDNDLENDNVRILRLNSESKFFNGLHEFSMEEKIRYFLHQFANFDFIIDYENSFVSFSKALSDDSIENNIKISRGEENIFKWCFFLAIVQLVLDREEAYNWVKYIYIDDPISSLDEQNAIIVAANIHDLFKDNDTIKLIISSHHSLFFNVVYNTFKRAEKFFLYYNKNEKMYKLINTGDTPFFHHIAQLNEIKNAIDTDRLFTYHFNILRTILEKVSCFHGYSNFSDCLHLPDDSEKEIFSRYLNIMSHSGYSIFEPKEMVADNKEYFIKIFNRLLENYKFNQEIFNELG